MIITCPNCRTRYQIPAASLGAKGRSVRCSSCSHRWHVEPFTAPGGPAEAAAPLLPRHPPAAMPPAVAEPAAPAQQERPADPEGDALPEPTPLASPPPAPAGADAAGRRGGGAVGTVGWLLLALVVLLLTALVVGRDRIVAAVPEALPVYRQLGLPVTLRPGLEFGDLGSLRRGDGPGGTVVITGEIRNTTGREVEVPQLRVALLDERHDELQSDLFPPPQRVLPPNGRARFELELRSPPEQARDFAITFADRS